MLPGTVVGSPMFMSHEMLKAEDYDKKTDVFSLMIALYELWFFQFPKNAAMNLERKVVYYVEYIFYPKYHLSYAK